MPLLDDSCFESIARELVGSRVGLLRMYGNVGDRMIDWATEQFLVRNDIRFCTLNRGGSEGVRDTALDEVDTILVSGGGNLGRTYENCYTLRQRYLQAGKRVVVLPQSITVEPEDLDVFDRVFLREEWSLSRFPSATLAPDMALGFDPPPVQPAKDLTVGIFLREDDESCVAAHGLSLGDPAVLCQSVIEYLELAGRFETIYTDRLHFAIAGLHVGCEVHLLAGSYEKNRSMFDTWLRALGCHWCDNATRFPAARRPATPDVAKSLVLPKVALVPWSCRPAWNHGVRREDTRFGRMIVFGPRRRKDLVLAPRAAEIANALDGHRDLDELLCNRSLPGEPDLLRRARDLQCVVQVLAQNGCLDPDSVRSATARTESVSPIRGQPSACYDLRVEGAMRSSSGTRIQAYLLPPGGQAIPLWFELADVQPACVTDHADPFILATLMRAMHDGLALRVSGAPVSPGLLKNLYELQAVFNRWYSQLHCVDILAEVSDCETTSEGPGIAAFSGDVDSSYTAFRQPGDREANRCTGVDTALFTAGYDVYVYSRNDLRQIKTRIQKLLSPLDVRLVTATTNLRNVYADWRIFRGLAVAASLSLFQRTHRRGLLASTISGDVPTARETHATVERMMGSNRFAIVPDDAGVSRMEKLMYLSAWPETIANLRFCFSSDDAGSNCGHCRRCVLTAIQLKALRLPLDGFVDPPSDERIEDAFRFLIEGMRPDHRDFRDLLDVRHRVRSENREFSWLPNLQRAIDEVRERTLDTQVISRATSSARFDQRKVPDT